MTTRERITELLKALSVTDYAFEKAANLSKGYMNKCKNPTAEVLVKLCGLYPTISAEWLLRGEGAMLRTSSCASVSAIGSHSSAAGHDVNNGDAVALQRTIDGMQRTIDALSATNARLVELLGK